MLRGAPTDYDEWGPGWAHAELEPYLNRAETALGTHRFADTELSPWHAAFMGWTGAIVHSVNVSGGVRWNDAFA